MLRRVSILTLLMTAVWGGTLSVADESKPSAQLPPLMPRDQEIAMAKSAGLPSFTDKATVYVLQRGGFVKALEGTNGFSCLVDRPFPGIVAPMCFDSEGTASLLPVHLREAELREQGMTREEIRRDTAVRFASGEYRAARRIGILYMLSKENRVPQRGKVVWFPPHLMFYAPHIRKEDVGAVDVAEAAHHTPQAPFMLLDGSPHAYIVVVVGDEMPRPPNPEQAEAKP